MGKGYGIKCSKCDYSKFFQLGIGMMYSPNHIFYGGYYHDDDKPMLESLVKSKKIKEHAFKLIKDGGKPTHGYEHSIYLCPKCNEFHRRFYFCIETANEKYEPKYYCSKCKRILIRVTLEGNEGKFNLITMNNEQIKWNCPKCGNDMLEQDFSLGVFMWD